MTDNKFATKIGGLNLHPTKGTCLVLYTYYYYFDYYGGPPANLLTNHIFEKKRKCAFKGN